MTLTTIVGAFLAVIARAKPERTKAEEEVEHLRRSHARLIDHIERLERELALAQRVVEHWRGEAQRLARLNREERERDDGFNAQMQQAQAQQALAIYNQQAAAHWQGACNCVPSRAQVWGAENGLVQQLNSFQGD